MDTFNTSRVESIERRLRGRLGDTHGDIARAALQAAGLTLFTACGARGAEVTRYFESSAGEKPRGSAGVSVAGDRLRLDADFALRAPRTQVIASVIAMFAGNERLGFETRVDGSEWSGNAPLDHRFDTRLHFRSSAPFFDELDGRVWRSPDGQSGRILKFGFYQKLRDTDPNIATPLT